MREYTFYNNKIKKTQNIKAESEEEAKKYLEMFCNYWKQNVNKKCNFKDFELKCISASHFIY